MATTSRALAFVTRWFDPSTVAGVFEPLIADWQREWQDAAPSRRPRVLIRGLAALSLAVLVSSPKILMTAPPPSLRRRIIARVATFVIAAALLLSIPFVQDLGSRITTWPLIAQLVLTLLPSGAVIALPFSMMLAVDVIRRERDLAPHVARATALKLAVAAVVLLALGHGFVMPAANQQFRVMTSQAARMARPIPGLRERTTLELFTDPAREQPALRYTHAGSIRKELSNRFVFALLPALFVWLRWIAHDVRRPRRFWPVPIAPMMIVAWVGFFTTYQLGMLSESAWNMAPGDGYWLPIVVATLIGLTQQWLTSRRRAAA